MEPGKPTNGKRRKRTGRSPWQGPKKLQHNRDLWETNGKVPINDSSELVKEINRLKAMDSRKENEGRVVELLRPKQPAKDRITCHKNESRSSKSGCFSAVEK